MRVLLIILLLSVAVAGCRNQNLSVKGDTTMPSHERETMQKIHTFLMFEGQAEEAMNFYIALFPNSKIESITRYGEGEAGIPGSVQHATFSLDGHKYMCIDSPAKHPFTFTPSISLYVNCSSVREIEYLFAKLSEGGKVLMPLDTYPFSKKFVWVNDKFGVSWQMTLSDES